MSDKKKEPDAVNRLLDILVNEVSLVDRAANKHRFLIVKRSEEMDDNTNTPTGATDDTSAETTTDSDTESVDESNVNATESGEGSETVELDNDDTALSIAAEGLGNLANAVEILSSADGEDTAATISQIVEQLQSVTDQLSNIGVEEIDETNETDEPDGVEDLAEQIAQEEQPNKIKDEQPNKTKNENSSIATIIESVRATLQQINTKLNASSQNSKSTPKEVPQQPIVTQKGDEQIIKQLTTLTGELQKLNGSVKAQQKRLIQLEKQFGLPNSTPKNERPQHDADDDVSWPMDLNNSFDRESIEKSVSFHDV